MVSENPMSNPMSLNSGTESGPCRALQWHGAPLPPPFGAKAHTVHEGVVDLDGVVQVFIIVTGATIEPGA